VAGRRLDRQAQPPEPHRAGPPTARATTARRPQRLREQRGCGERRADGRRPQPDPLGVPAACTSGTTGSCTVRYNGSSSPSAGVEHALEGPQRRVPELVGATGGATHRVRGRPAPRHRQAEPEQGAAHPSRDTTLPDCGSATSSSAHVPRSQPARHVPQLIGTPCGTT
jgi:hypothetical protein